MIELYSHRYFFQFFRNIKILTCQNIIDNKFINNNKKINSFSQYKLFYKIETNFLFICISPFYNTYSIQ